MEYDLDITNKGIYLHVRIEGVQCLSNFKDVWSRIGRECDKQASRRVLCEGCLEGSGMTLDIHEYRRRISETEVPQGTKIAIVCSNEDYDQFGFDARAVTTGMPVFPRIFTSVEEGVRWLTK
jgi:hypothetical protein